MQSLNCLIRQNQLSMWTTLKIFNSAWNSTFKNEDFWLNYRQNSALNCALEYSNYYLCLNKNNTGNSRPVNLMLVLCEILKYFKEKKLRMWKKTKWLYINVKILLIWKMLIYSTMIDIMGQVLILLLGERHGLDICLRLHAAQKTNKNCVSLHSCRVWHCWDFRGVVRHTLAGVPSWVGTTFSRRAGWGARMNQLQQMLFWPCEIQGDVAGDVRSDFWTGVGERMSFL